jgi:c(7)-type cytochrome triheme protein
LVCAVTLGPHTLEAADRIFSHQLHLGKAGATCVDCHVAASASTAATESLLPSAAQCAACHDGSKAKQVDASWLAQQQPAERSYRFNHNFHLQMGSVAPIIMGAIENGSYLGKHQDSHHHMSEANACES